ncbi:MAG: PstS family phosphate ABC transporter substrate-binding protein [Oscillatoriaceae cyanobacterium Prado104]|nr:PstS family phosphate ABC transporter substrate-binding protein [Oscillatoriaceae cyanobacterium Prado104]
MKFKLNGLTIAGASAFVAAAIGLAVPAIQAQGQRVVKIDGSSTVYPITEAVAEEFQKANRGIQVTVGVSGTGGGFKKFCRGETDISNASRPILKAEMQACAQAGVRYIELPVAYDALTVVVNNQNTWAQNLTVAELKKMWEPGAQGKINNWNQIRAGFPNAPLKLFGAGTASGTFDYFTEAIVGKSKSSRGDFTASEDDNVLVNGVSRDKNAIGYFGYAYYEANKGKIRAVAINGGKGPVLPSAQTVQNGTYQPLSRPLFIYVSVKSADKPEVKQFVEYYIKNGAKLARDVKYVALPPQAYTTTMGHFTKRRVGTIFGGEEAVGLTIEELLKREAR